MQQEHIVRLETRPPNIEGQGQVSARDLVINSLRMRPDRIIIGECRGAETLDMLQAMNTGHDGSLTTLHANSPRDALSRLETMVMFSGIDLPEKNIKSQIASAINIIILPTPKRHDQPLSKPVCKRQTHQTSLKTDKKQNPNGKSHPRENLNTNLSIRYL